MEVSIREGESQEALLKRFLKTVQMSGILREYRSKSRFISKGDAARIKAKKAAQRRRRQMY